MKVFFVSFLGNRSCFANHDRPCACTHYLLKLRLGFYHQFVGIVSFLNKIFAWSRFNNINYNYPGEGTIGGIHEVRIACSFPNLNINRYTIFPL